MRKINLFTVDTQEEMDKNISDLRRDKILFQRSQEVKVKLILESLRGFKHISDEMNNIRRDTNGLLKVNSERARGLVQPQYVEP